MTTILAQIKVSNKFITLCTWYEEDGVQKGHNMASPTNVVQKVAMLLDTGAAD
jgi:hypothetical protein